MKKKIENLSCIIFIMHVTPVTSFDTIDNSVIIIVFTVDIYAFGGDLNRVFRNTALHGP